MKLFQKRDVSIVVIAAVAVQILAFCLIDRIMFQPGEIRYTMNFPGVIDVSTNEATVAAFVAGNLQKGKVILYCHGNAEDILDSSSRFVFLSEHGCAFSAVDYPGYGCSAGRPSESGCYGNVTRLYNWLVDEQKVSPTNIIVVGFSIGTGPAVELASKRNVGALILMAPFLSAPRVMTHIRLLLCDPFQNERKICNVRCPCVIIHGTKDTVIPVSHGMQLYESVKAPKKLVKVVGAGHNDLIDMLGEDAFMGLVMNVEDLIK